MMSKQSFIKGTIVLMCANAISKILGAVFKIPLTYYLKEEGMAIYNTAFSVYVMFLSLMISGIPISISKMVAEETALNNHQNVKKIITVSSIFLGSLSLLGSVLLYFGAEFFSFAMNEPKALYCVKMLSPSVFFVALGTVYKSFYQGKANMTPTAISQVIEAAIKLLAGLGLCIYSSHLSKEYSAAAAITGVTIGEVIATFILFALYLPHHFTFPGGKSDKSSKSIISSILVIAIPAIIASTLSDAMNLIDISVIRKCLERIQFDEATAKSFLLQYSSYTTVFDDLPQTLTLSPQGSQWLYGAYSGYALTVFHLPIGILATLGVSILPIIAGALAVKNTKRVHTCIEISTKITLLISLPTAFLLAFFSEPILNILFKNTASSQMLSMLSPCLVFICLSQLFNAVSHSGGRIIRPFIFSFIGALVKLILNVVFILNPRLNMKGVMLSANISYLVVLILSYLSIRQQYSLKNKLSRVILKPFICSFFMVLIMYIIYPPFLIIFPGEALSFILCCMIGALVFVLSLLCTRCISRDEIKLLRE